MFCELGVHMHLLVSVVYVCDGVYNVQDNINLPIYMLDHMVAMLPEVCFI